MVGGLWNIKQEFGKNNLTRYKGLNAVFTTLRTDDDGAKALVAALDPAPGTAEAVQRLQAAGWEIIVASAGCGWYIERLLAQQGLALTIQASGGRFTPETELVMTPDPAGPYFHPQSGIDKPAVVRDTLARDNIVAYAGDSLTDRAGALMVAPERRFVTGWLQGKFAAEGVEHVPFGEWPEIADQLLVPDTNSQMTD